MCVCVFFISMFYKFLLTKKNKKYNLEVENYVLFSGFSENLNLEDSLSDSCQGLL